MSDEAMVLRCETTGHVFYSQAEAKLHTSETGFAAFAQVDLSEPAYVCTETGKIAFNQQQKEMHQRRVPDAKTWETITVAELRDRHLAKVAAAADGGSAVVETEEEALLRSAGLANKMQKLDTGAGSSSPSGPPVVTKETVGQLVEMGFSQLRAEKACVRTQNAGIEAAVNWLGDHLADADIDEPLATSPVVKTQDEVDAAAAATAGAATSQLTPAEKKAKLEEALARARAKKAGIDVASQKAIEKARRESGKEMVKTFAEQQEQLRKRQVEERKREKKAFEEERARLREKLAKDREEKIKKGLIVEKKAEPAAAAVTPAPAVAAEVPPKPKTDREEAAAAAAGAQRSFDEPELSLDEARTKLCGLSDSKIRPALDLMQKMGANIAKAPDEPKYRKMRLSNPKVAEGLVHVAGARQWLRANGWRIVEREFIELPIVEPSAAQAAAFAGAVASLVSEAAAAQEKRRVDELEARKREAAERVAKQKAEREAIRAAMSRDRNEVAARGPAQASVAVKLSSGPAQMKKFEADEDREERERQQGP